MRKPIHLAHRPARSHGTRYLDESSMTSMESDRFVGRLLEYTDVMVALRVCSEHEHRAVP